MQVDSKKFLVALGKVALSSPAEPRGRIAALVDLALLCKREGDTKAADHALTEAVAVLQSASETSPDGFDVSAEAWALGDRAMKLQHYPVACEAFEAGFAGLEIDSQNPLRGMLWQAIGVCRLRLGETRKALLCLRTAADAKREVNDSRSRIVTLLSLIGAEAQWGKQELCDLVVAESIRVLEDAVGGPIESDGDLASLALEAGRATEAAHRPALARRIYELALALREEGRDAPPTGMILQDIGDTWASQGDGSRALAAYRAANERKRGSRDPLMRLITLNSLAAGEARWGERSRCELAIAEAADIARKLNGRAADPAVANIGQKLRQLALELRRIDLATAFYGIAPPDRPDDEQRGVS